MIATFDINKYIWTRPEIISILSRNGERPYTSFGDLNCPVFAVNEQPESDNPYVVYTYDTNVRDNGRYWMKEETIQYRIWDTSVKRMSELEYQLRRYLGRYDLSAEAFIKWAIDGQHVVHTRPYKIFYAGSEEMIPQEQEGGVVGKLMVFEVCYDPCKNLDELDTSTPA